MLPIIINTVDTIDSIVTVYESFIDGYKSGYDEQLKDDSIDVHIQLAKLAAKAYAWLVYFPYAFFVAYCVIGTESYEWETQLNGEMDVFFPIIAPILYATHYESRPDYRTLQQWCKSVYLPAKGKFDDLYQSWLRFCRYAVDNNALWYGKTSPRIH